MNNCHLCSNLTHQSSPPVWNEPLLESANFVVLPSLGALVEGWTLIIPKQHFLCMGALPKCLLTEYEEIKRSAYALLQRHYGQVCAFEHGPHKPNCNVGCSVDHAHLHLVPLTFNLGLAVTPFLPRGATWRNAGIEACQAAFSQSESYLYLEQPIGNGRIVTSQDFGSQLFRRAIASEIGIPLQFNWREHQQLPNVSATISKLRVQSGIAFTWKSQHQMVA